MQPQLGIISNQGLNIFAESHKVDLLVMVSHGHRLLGDLLWGETVDPVWHQVEVPILVVR